MKMLYIYETVAIKQSFHHHHHHHPQEKRTIKNELLYKEIDY